jgi:hypothetical protein
MGGSAARVRAGGLEDLDRSGLSRACLRARACCDVQYGYRVRCPSEHGMLRRLGRGTHQRQWLISLVLWEVLHQAQGRAW